MSILTIAVRSAQRQVQEPERIEHRLRRVPKALDDCPLRDFSRTFAFRVTTHAIARNQQRRVFGYHDADAILVGLAAALQA